MPASLLYPNRTHPCSGEPIESLEFRRHYTVSPIVFSLAPTADAFVRDGTFAGTNAGLSPSLLVQKNSVGANRQAYLTFDIRSSTGLIQPTILRVFGRLNTTGAAVASLGVFPVASTTWSETAITWKNKPVAGAVALLTQKVGTVARWYSFDVTTYVAAERQAGKTSASFALVATQSSAFSITFNADKAKINRPVLSIGLPQALPPVVSIRPDIAAGAPADLSVTVGAGRVSLPGGTAVDFVGGSLSFATPQIVHRDGSGIAPDNFDVSLTPVQFDYRSLQLVPPGTTGIIGGLYQSMLPDSVTIKNASGTLMVEGTDYLLNHQWGQVVNMNSRLGVPGIATVQFAFDSVLQRIDLIEVLADGTLKVKQGVSVATCPSLPAADAGATPLAGVFIHTLDGVRRDHFTIHSSDIYPIVPVAAPLPINPSAIARTRAKLAAHQAVNIGWLGDSIMAGAEAGQWWHDRSQSFTTGVVSGLKARFGTINIAETAAYQPGITTAQALPYFENNILRPNLAGRHVDLVVIALGMNDLGATTLSGMIASLTDYTRRAKAAGMEVMLVTPMDANPAYSPNPEGASTGEISTAIRALAVQENVACADVNTVWRDQASRGIAPLSQLHNTANHPGPAGQKLYASTILSLFQ